MGFLVNGINQLSSSIGGEEISLQMYIRTVVDIKGLSLATYLRIQEPKGKLLKHYLPQSTFNT